MRPHRDKPILAHYTVLILIFALISACSSDDDDSSRVGSSPTPTTAPGDDDLSPGDDDLSPGDDDLSPGDDDLSPGDDDLSPGDDDTPATDADLDGYFPPGDCDDTDPLVNPGVEEVCGDGIDNNCDGWVDKGGKVVTWYPDQDGDGYGDDALAVPACAQPEKFILTGGDCDDTRSDVNPSAEEVCDDPATGAMDNDCDGEIDEGLINACGECGPLPEETCNHIDDDCNGLVDDIDLNGDGIFDCSDYDGDGVDSDDGDCDDSDATVYPGAEESCDGYDNDCDGQVDEEGAGCECVVEPVSGPYVSIPAVLADILEGTVSCTVIVVQPGTYRGTVDFTGIHGPLRVVAAEGPENTILTLADGESGSVIFFPDDDIQADVALVGFTITGGTGSGGGTCPAETCGGGIHIDGCAAPRLEGNRIVGNQADIGGGLFIGDCANPSAPGPNLADNRIGDEGVPNRALECHGGGVYIGAANVTLEADTDIRISFNTIGQDDGTCDQNDGRGVGLHVTGGTLTANRARLEVSSNHFATSIYNTSGGGAFLQDARLDLTGGTWVLEANRIDCGDNATCRGGGLFATGSDIDLDGTTLVVRANYSSDDGGGVYLSSNTLTLEGDATAVFDANEAGRSGGAFHVGAGGRAQLASVTFSDNIADLGGAAYNAGELAVEGASVEDNAAGSDGGGIVSVGLLDLGGSVFTGNSASGGGGAIHAGGTLRMSSCTFASNGAGIDGGAIEIAGNTNLEDLADLIFSQNTAAGNGGAVEAHASRLTLARSTFEDNEAGLDGGAIHGEGPLAVTSSLFRNNTAATSGGAIRMAPGSPGVTLDGVQFSSNVAGSSGGAISIDADLLELSFAVLDRNEAADCAATDILGGSSSIAFAHVYSNGATAGGNGAIVCLDGTEVDLHHVILADNATAGTSGGTLRVSATASRLEYLTLLRSGLADEAAADVRVEGSTATVSHDILVGSGAGIGLSAGAASTVDGCDLNDISGYGAAVSGLECTGFGTLTPPFVASSDDGNYCNEDLHLESIAEHPEYGAYGGPDGDWTLVPAECGGCETTELSRWYRDEDGDTYGDAASPVLACDRPPGYVSNGDDCDDHNMTIHPGASEVLRNGKDDDCDGVVDERN